MPITKLVAIMKTKVYILSLIVSFAWGIVACQPSVRPSPELAEQLPEQAEQDVLDTTDADQKNDNQNEAQQESTEPVAESAQLVTTGGIELPFIDDFDGGALKAEWGVISGQPVVANSSVSPPEGGRLILEIGDSTLNNYSVEIIYSVIGNIDKRFIFNQATSIVPRWGGGADIDGGDLFVAAGDDWTLQEKIPAKQYGDDENSIARFDVQGNTIKVYFNNEFAHKYTSVNGDLSGPFALVTHNQVHKVSILPILSQEEASIPENLDYGTNTPAGSQLALGETWHQDGLEMQVKNMNYETACSGWFEFEISLVNRTGANLNPEIIGEEFKLVDNTGESHALTHKIGAHYPSCYAQSIWHMPNQDMNPPDQLDIAIRVGEGTGNDMPSGLTSFTLTVGRAGPIENATWKFEAP